MEGWKEGLERKRVEGAGEVGEAWLSFEKGSGHGGGGGGVI